MAMFLKRFLEVHGQEHLDETQFMPSTFHKFAIDFDNDNKINLFKKSDALASGANYLNQVGWNNNLLWGRS